MNLKDLKINAKIINFLKLALCFFIFGCAKPNPAYILSNFPEIQNLEESDHKACKSFKINFDQVNNYNSELYWRCRFSLTKYHLPTEKNTAKEQKTSFEVNDLINKISVKILNNKESILDNENKKMDDKDHQKCLKMGYELYSEDQMKINDYFSCRKSLIEDREAVPPFGNTEYLKYRNKSYNLGYVIDNRIKESIKEHQKLKEIYPTCVKYNIVSINFKRCKEAQDNMNQCLTEINRKKFLKENEERVNCQKQTYIRYDDDLLKNNDEENEAIKKTNQSFDYQNNNNFSSLGLQESQFSAVTIDNKEQEKLKKQREKINSRSGLYSRYELTKLRQNFITTCNKNSDLKTKEYAQKLTDECNKKAKFQTIEEEK